jgi:hypothetical protein
MLSRESSVVASPSQAARIAPADLVVYQKLLCYVREFLARPCKHVGRPGPTCPFVPKVGKPGRPTPAAMHDWLRGTRARAAS